MNHLDTICSPIALSLCPFCALPLPSHAQTLLVLDDKGQLKATYVGIYMLYKYGLYGMEYCLVFVLVVLGFKSESYT